MTYYFEDDGTFSHRTGSDGKFFDTFGNNQGYVDRDGRYFDAAGAYKGCVKEDGMFYSADGRLLGYTDGKHWPFDPMGVFVESKRKPEKEEDDAPKEEKKGVLDSIKDILNRDR